MMSTELIFFRDSAMSDSEMTTDLSDKNCTGEELDSDNFHNLPKVVSQSTGVGGGVKRPVTFTDQIDLKRPKHDEVIIDCNKKMLVHRTGHDLVSSYWSYCRDNNNYSRHEQFQ
jgi:hypothetical protein